MNCWTKSSYIISGSPSNSKSSAVTSSLFLSFSSSSVICFYCFFVSFYGFDKLISFRGRPFFFIGLCTPVAAAIANLVFLFNLSCRFFLPSFVPLISFWTLNLTSPSSYFFILVGCILRLNGWVGDVFCLSLTREDGDWFEFFSCMDGLDNPLASLKDPFAFSSVNELDFREAD